MRIITAKLLTSRRTRNTLGNFAHQITKAPNLIATDERNFGVGLLHVEVRVHTYKL